MFTRRARRGLRGVASECVPERSEKGSPSQRRRARRVTGGSSRGHPRRAPCQEPLSSPARQSPAAAWAANVEKHSGTPMEADLGRDHFEASSLSPRRARWAGPWKEGAANAAPTFSMILSSWTSTAKTNKEMVWVCALGLRAGWASASEERSAVIS